VSSGVSYLVYTALKVENAFNEVEMRRLNIKRGQISQSQNDDDNGNHDPQEERTVEIRLAHPN